MCLATPGSGAPCTCPRPEAAPVTSNTWRHPVYAATHPVAALELTCVRRSLHHTRAYAAACRPCRASTGWIKFVHPGASCAASFENETGCSIALTAQLLGLTTGRTRPVAPANAGTAGPNSRGTMARHEEKMAPSPQRETARRPCLTRWLGPGAALLSGDAQSCIKLQMLAATGCCAGIGLCTQPSAPDGVHTNAPTSLLSGPVP